MSIVELLLIAVGLSMDAFAVSVCKGLATKKVTIKHYLCAGAWFGGFQALMPTIGYFLGSTFAQYIEQLDHWVAFILLAVIGINMIKEAFGEDEEANDSFAVKTMFLMAVATSIDALAVGKLSIELGAGRKTKEDKVDHTVGIKLNKLVGEKVKRGDVLATLYVKDKIDLDFIDTIFTIDEEN